MPSLALPLVAFAAAIVAAGASAETNDAGVSPVELWLSGAPLGRVLEHVAGTEGVEVKIDPSIEGVVDGRLEGERESVLARLVVEHELAVHGNGDTIWFDRTDRPVVEFVELAPDDADAALSLLDGTEIGEATPDAVIERSETGVMLSGSRAFVEASLDRLAALPQASPDTSPSAPLASSAGTGVPSVSDIPGYDVDYTKESPL